MTDILKVMDKLDDSILRQIESETGLIASKVKDELAIIRNWVNQQPHLPQLKDDEETNLWLYNFLFYSKNRIEKVKKHLDMYFTCKSVMPEFYLNRDPEAAGIKANVQVLHLVTVPKLTPEGYRVHIFSHVMTDPSAYEPKEFMRRALMMCDWKMKHDLTAGDLIVFYMKNSSLAHWGRYNLVTLSRFVGCLTNAYPLRIKAVHFIPAPAFATHVMNSPFITGKLKKRMKFHSSGNISQIFEEIPPDCLPEELGGTYKATLDELNESTYENIRNMKKWFLENEKMKSDESKRLHHIQENDLFGCDGTFRSLNLD